jgi:hypothetical protein
LRGFQIKDDISFVYDFPQISSTDTNSMKACDENRGVVFDMTHYGFDYSTTSLFIQASLARSEGGKKFVDKKGNAVE